MNTRGNGHRLPLLLTVKTSTIFWGVTEWCQPKISVLFNPAISPLDIYSIKHTSIPKYIKKNFFREFWNSKSYTLKVHQWLKSHHELLSENRCKTVYKVQLIALFWVKFWITYMHVSRCFVLQMTNYWLKSQNRSLFWTSEVWRLNGSQNCFLQWLPVLSTFHSTISGILVNPQANELALT